jgi:hypothetical protein
MPNRFRVPATRVEILLAAAALVLSAASCTDRTPLGLTPANKRAANLSLATARPSAIRPEEQSFADLADRVASSAGYFVDERGKLVVWVRDSADDGKALQASAGALQAMQSVRLRAPANGIEIRRARFSFWQLANWRDLIFREVLGQNGVIRLDLDETANRVDVRLDRNVAASKRPGLMRHLDSLGVDTNAVRVSTGSVVVPALGRGRAPRLSATYLYNTNDTIIGGLQFFHKNVSDTTQTNWCTLGTVLDYGGVRSFLTASHCSTTQWATDGAYANQATDGDRRIGYESSDPSGYGCAFNFRVCRGSDAGIYTMESGIPSAVGIIAKTTSVSWTWGTSGSITIDTSSPYFVVTDVGCGCSYGQTIQKVGVTTGWTTGWITDTCVDENDGSHIQTCAMETNMYVAPGDSGSPVFILATSGYDTDVKFAGIVDGIYIDTTVHKSYFSPLSRIQADLTSSMALTRPANLSTPSISGEVVSSVPGSSWGSITGATYYEVWRQWYRYSDGSGSAGWEYLGHQSSEFWDSTMSVTSYTGTTVPTFRTPGWVGYYVVAANTADRSASSTAKYFQLSP